MWVNWFPRGGRLGCPVEDERDEESQDERFESEGEETLDAAWFKHRDFRLQREKAQLTG
jgi:hypothetical protein